MTLWRTTAKAIMVLMVGMAYTPMLAPALAAPQAAPTPNAAVGHIALADDPDDPPADSDGSDDDSGPPPCLPGNAPSAVTGRCVPDFPEHVCPDGGMSIWNRCPRSDPCAGGGASVNGECPGPTERFCRDGVSFQGSCPEDSAAALTTEESRHLSTVPSGGGFGPGQPTRRGPNNCCPEHRCPSGRCPR